MYKAIIVALALSAPVLATVPLLLQTSTTTAGVSTVTGTTTLLSGSAALGLFSIAGIGAAIGLGLLLRGDLRKKRSINSLSTDASFAIISNLEPAQCYRRLICDIASGKMEANENDEIILAPFKEVKKYLGQKLFSASICKLTSFTIYFQGTIAEANPASYTFEYLAAAEVGRAVASIEKCELRYSCPISGQELRTIFEEAQA